MCVVCVSAVTIASLIAPTPTPVVQNSVSDYTITRAACPKSKVNKIENNRICLKDGRFYRWAVKKTVTPAPVPSVSTTPRPTVSPTPKPTVAPTPTPVPTTTTVQYAPPSVVGDSVERCKLIESSQRRGFTWAGFPNLQPPTQKFGTVKWAFIPVDFSDMPGEKDFRSSMNIQMNLLSEWFDNASEGKFKVEWVVSDKWVTLPGVSTDYTLTKGINSTPGGVKFFRTAMATADPTFDFTNVQTVIFILPSNQNIANEGENGFPWEQHVKDYVTNEGRISSFSISGKYQTKDNKSLWNYWVHEFGHSIGLPHVGGNGPERPLYGDWTVMADQDGATRELGGWLRFLSQWMPDENVYCKDSKSMTKVEMDLVPVSNKESGIKLAMFTLSETKALLIESRRVNKFSCTTTKPRNGVLVSLLDLSLGHGQDFLLPISPANRNIMETVMCNNTMSNSSVDILLYQGDKVSFGGLTIEVIKQGSFDKIVVTKQ